ncbi:MAG: GNAT family N-acetyltransferase [Candidatus Eiseniibacteriota bacterium]|nr:MAG: GNAT family N-acetyltransferase [Candidatus Eisenbacteria bacterium]
MTGTQNGTTRDTSRRGLVDRVSEAYADGGCALVAKKTSASVKKALFRRSAALWYGRSLASSLPAERSSVPGTFSPIGPSELALWLREGRALLWAADPRELEVASQLGHGWTCWKLCGEIAAFCKIGHGRVFVEDFDRAISLPAWFAFLSDVYVLKEMRRRGIARQLILSTMRLLKEDSFTGMGCHVPASNRASIALFTSLGFRSFGEIRFTRVLGFPIFSERPERILERMAASDSNESVR